MILLHLVTFHWSFALSFLSLPLCAIYAKIYKVIYSGLYLPLVSASLARCCAVVNLVSNVPIPCANVLIFSSKPKTFINKLSGVMIGQEKANEWHNTCQPRTQGLMISAPAALPRRQRGRVAGAEIIRPWVRG